MESAVLSGVPVIGHRNSGYIQSVCRPGLAARLPKKVTNTERVIQKAVELVDASPPGKRYSDLVRDISAAFPDIPVNTVRGSAP
jgi:hypothetical protein